MNFKQDKSYRLWAGVWITSFLLILGVSWMYFPLPVDGSSGDSSSFTPEGFVVHRLIEERPDGLQIGDIVARMNGISIEEWLRRPPFGRALNRGEIIQYDIIRKGKHLSLQIQLAPVPFRSVISQLGTQTLTILLLFGIGLFLFWKQPQNQSVRWIMLFCATTSLQYWIDGYNMQPGALLWGWPFWIQWLLEQLSYSFSYAALVVFALAFLYPNGILKRYPIALPTIILFSGIIIKMVAMTTAPTLTAAIELGNRVSIIPAMAQLALAAGIAIYFLFTGTNQTALAQMRIMLAGISLPLIITLAYSATLVFSQQPFVSRNIGVFSVLLVPISFTIAILRYQMFDIEIILNKGLVYGLLTALLAGLYILLVHTLTALTQIMTANFDQNMVTFIATMSIALAFNPLRQRVQATIDRTFFRNKINYRRLLPELSAKLSNNIVLEQLTRVLTQEIPRNLQISNASLQIFDAETRAQPSQHITKEQDKTTGLLTQFGRETQENRIELNIPLIVDRAGPEEQDTSTRVVGLYHLGKKLSGKPYTNEEVKLLTTLGKQAAVSLENAYLYREVERHSQTLELKIKERTQDLAAAKNTAENAYILLQTIMNNIDALVYVGDMQTGKILFANQPMQALFGPVEGKVCWQILYKNKTAVCDFCTNSLLIDQNGNPAGVQRREIQDLFSGRWYSTMSSAIRWVDGRIVRLTTRLDITEIKEAENILRINEYKAAKEEERRRLARDLHDTVTQSLHSLALTADTSQRLLKRERYAALPESLQLLEDSARQALREMRLLLHELQLSEDEEIDLQEALSTRLAIVEQRVGIKTILNVTGQDYLPRTIKTEIFYIIMEALNNSIKHASANRIAISIRANDKRAEVSVTDNGQGFDTKPLGGKGMGLENMKFRAEKIAGILTISSKTSGGATVRLSVNL